MLPGFLNNPVIKILRRYAPQDDMVLFCYAPQDDTVAEHIVLHVANTVRRYVKNFITGMDRNSYFYPIIFAFFDN